jgi:hypothetical protein
MEENILVSNTSITAITLPAPSQSINIGTTFNIYKTYTNSSIITVIAPTNQQILGDRVSATSYNFGLNQTYLTVTCIANLTTGLTWVARSNGLYPATNLASTISATYTFSTNPVFNDASIPTSKIIDLNINSYNQYYDKASNTLINAAITLASPYYRYYSVSFTTNSFTITIPNPSSALLGMSFTFRRVYASSTGIIRAQCVGGTSLIYSLSNTGLALQAIFNGSTGFSVSLTCMINNSSTPSWFITEFQ